MTNHSGKTATSRITFKPLIIYETRGGYARINRRNYFTGDLLEFFDCFFGEYKTATYLEDMELTNEWVVDSSSLDVSGHCGYGANILERPVPGSIYPKIKIEYWADGFSDVLVRTHVVIKGPKGFRYSR